MQTSTKKLLTNVYTSFRKIDKILVCYFLSVDIVMKKQKTELLLQSNQEMWYFDSDQVIWLANVHTWCTIVLVIRLTFFYPIPPDPVLSVFCCSFAMVDELNRPFDHAWHF